MYSRKPYSSLPYSSVQVTAPLVDVAGSCIVSGEQPAVREREMRGYRWFQSGLVAIGVSVSITSTVITEQEYPSLGRGTFSAGVQGPDVRPSQIKDSAITAQERPREGRGTFSAGIQGPNVRTQVADRAIVPQERPREGYAFARPSLQGPDVASGIGSIIRGQERPFHPLPFKWDAVIPAGLTPQGTLVVTVQQFPDIGRSFLQNGIQGPNVRPPVRDTIISKQQEIPDLGRAVIAFGGQGPNVASGVGGILTKQEFPFHPLPFKYDSPGPPAQIAVQGKIFVTQFYPDLGRVFSQFGIQGPNVRVPVVDTVIRAQELPREGRSTFWSGIQGPDVEAPTINELFIRQELPREGYTVTRASLQGPNVRPPVSDSAITRQERPREGYSFSQFGRQGPNVGSGIGSVFTKQELPGHPLPTFWYFFVTPPGDMLLGQSYAIVPQQLPDLGRVVTQVGVQGPDVAPPVRNTVFSRQQELPRLGIGTWSAGVQGPNVEPSRTTSIFVRQVLPDLGRSFIRAGISGPNVASEVGRVVTKQEQPFHPTGWRWSFIPAVATPVSAVRTSIFVRSQEAPLSTRRIRFSPGQQGPDVIPPRRILQATEEQFTQYNHPKSFVYWHTHFVPPVAIAILHGSTAITKQERPFHPGFFSRGVDIPLNGWPPFVTVFPPLQENLTRDMLGKVNQTRFYADPGFDRQIITSINYPHGQYYVVGWTPIGGVKYPIGNMYNRDLVEAPRPVAQWFHTPDMVGGWITEHMNLTRDYVTLSNQKSFFVEPLELHVNNLMPQLYPAGLTPVGINTTRRGILGVKPYG